LSSDKLLEIIQLQTEVAQQSLDLSAIMDLVTERMQQMTRADGASVELIEKTELVYSAASGIAEKFLGLRLDIENSLSGKCMQAGAPLISNDMEKDDRVNKEACRKIGLSSMIVVPLICRSQTVGVIKVLSRQVGHFTEEDSRVLELMTGLIAAEMYSAIHNGESELFYQATHDSLTGIANRSLFYDRLRQKLARAMRRNERFGIITLDMDGLKGINDNYGHRAGDAALQEVALRIKFSLRESDTVSRLGGDEFGILADTTAGREDIHALIHRVNQEITQPFTFEGEVIPLRASIGYALFSEDGIELEVLIEKADRAMYEVKRKQKRVDDLR
jgi:diguanylate cyclase (GGDEF)-like protein